MDKNKFKIIIVILAFTILCFMPATIAKADTASAISFGTIDYENLTLQVYNNNNSIVYYTTDKSNDNSWTEIESGYNNSTSSYTMDISWVPSGSDTTIYFKGNTAEKIRSITIPAQNSTFSVTYNKADGSFDFEDTDNADNFEWRKLTDYDWHTVSLNENSGSYVSFLSTMEDLRLKGARIVFRIAPIAGTGADDPGSRPSTEQTVSIVTRGMAPVVKVNSLKLTVNTTSAMEYYDEASSAWIECSAGMSLSDIAPKTLYENGGKTVTVKIRKSETDSVPYSKTATLTIPGQDAAPSIGDNSAAVTHYILNSKLVMIFNKASSTNIYQYCIKDSDDDLDITTASWRTVNSTNAITISSTAAKAGDIIYIRKKGKDATSNDDAVLSSAVNHFTVAY